MYRTTRHYLLQYFVLPFILIMSDIMIGVFSHFSGAIGIENIFNIELYQEYFSYHFDTFLIVLVIAISISLCVEWLIRDIEKKINKEGLIKNKKKPWQE
jgi:uncharacterized membrane protein